MRYKKEKENDPSCYRIASPDTFLLPLPIVGWIPYTLLNVRGLN